MQFPMLRLSVPLLILVVTCVCVAAQDVPWSSGLPLPRGLRNAATVSIGSWCYAVGGVTTSADSGVAIYSRVIWGLNVANPNGLWTELATMPSFVPNVSGTAAATVWPFAPAILICAACRDWRDDTFTSPPAPQALFVLLHTETWTWDSLVIPPLPQPRLGAVVILFPQQRLLAVVGGGALTTLPSTNVTLLVGIRTVDTLNIDSLTKLPPSTPQSPPGQWSTNKSFDVPSSFECCLAHHPVVNGAESVAFVFRCCSCSSLHPVNRQSELVHLVAGSAQPAVKITKPEVLERDASDSIGDMANPVAFGAYGIVLIIRKPTYPAVTRAPLVLLLDLAADCLFLAPLGVNAVSSAFVSRVQSSVVAVSNTVMVVGGAEWPGSGSTTIATEVRQLVDPLWPLPRISAEYPDNSPNGFVFNQSNISLELSLGTGSMWIRLSPSGTTCLPTTLQSPMLLPDVRVDAASVGSVAVFPASYGVPVGDYTVCIAYGVCTGVAEQRSVCDNAPSAADVWSCTSGMCCWDDALQQCFAYTPSGTASSSSSASDSASASSSSRASSSASSASASWSSGGGAATHQVPAAVTQTTLVPFWIGDTTLTVQVLPATTSPSLAPSTAVPPLSSPTPSTVTRIPSTSAAPPSTGSPSSTTDAPHITTTISTTSTSSTSTSTTIAPSAVPTWIPTATVTPLPPQPSTSSAPQPTSETPSPQRSPVAWRPSTSDDLFMSVGGGVAVLLTVGVILWRRRRGSSVGEERRLLLNTPVMDPTTQAQSTTVKYRLLQRIGRGLHGTVYLVERAATPGSRFAMKYMACDDAAALKRALSEFEVIRCMAAEASDINDERNISRHIIHLVDLFVEWPAEPKYHPVVAEPSLPQPSATSIAGHHDDVGSDLLNDDGEEQQQHRFVCIVMEYFPHGDLRQLIVGRRLRPLPEIVVLRIGVQLCDVLAFLHSRSPPVVHRDVKPENILVHAGSVAADAEGVLSDDVMATSLEVILTDFGLASHDHRSHMMTRAGSLHYAAPEAWRGHYTAAVDMWSVGCVLYVCCTGRVTGDTARVMFSEVTEPGFADALRAELSGLGYGTTIIAMMESLLQCDPNLRPSAAVAAEALRGSWNTLLSSTHSHVPSTQQ